MNDEPVQQPIPPEHPQLSLRTLLSAFALAVLFAGSAGLSAEYLAGLATPRESLAAAAAAAPSTFPEITLQAKAAYVVDLQNNRVLYSLNPDVQLPLASITKVPLALVVAESVPLDTVITIPRDTAPQSTAERLAAGEKWLMSDILTYTLVSSSNAGAEILAEAANGAIHARFPDSPLEGATLWRMNALMRELDLNRTYFLNVSGLDLSTSQAGAYGTARDVANLFAYALSTDISIFGGTARDGVLLTSIDGVNASATNTNKALDSIHGLIMGKTGTTDLAGGNLAIVFEVGPAHPIVAVVLGSTESGRFEDMKQLVQATEESIALQ